MRIVPHRDRLEIKFEGIECVYAFRRKIIVPKNIIRKIHWEEGFQDWRTIEFRLPGSFLPGAIIAGSFYAKEGWDFIYSTRPSGWTRPKLKDVLVIETNKQRYRRIIIGYNLEQAKEVLAWQNQ